MVATLILVRDENGDLNDQEGHLRNAAGQRLDDQRVVIPDQDVEAPAAAQVVDEAARPITLDDYNRPNQTPYILVPRSVYAFLLLPLSRHSLKMEIFGFSRSS
ncbi:hypothetical protein F2Q70_00003143 [Brassica cretica]|uniref:Uncharacterized protein n=1 Tax=Brassica cretica TaxID=69181 RepID=A0A8S9IW26_BRACR|nr:hypothetical protein F2Q70_00003143 [Brassica cretica]